MKPGSSNSVRSRKDRQPVSGFEATDSKSLDRQLNDRTGDISASVGKSVLNWFLRQYLVVLLIPIMFAVFAILSPSNFLTLSNLQSMITLNAPLLILSVGMTVVLAAGEFDLSFYGVVGMSAGIVASAPGMPLWALLTISLLLAVAAGLINSLFVVALNVSAFIATLGMGVVTLGVGLGVTNSQTISNPFGSLESALAGTFFGVAHSVYIALAALIALWVYLEHTTYGRHLYFVGASRRAATYAGIKVNATRVLAIALPCVTAWAAGLFILAESGAVVADYGSGYLLSTFAAVFLGYATIKPGRYNALGTLVGVAILAIGTTGLQVVGAPLWVTEIFTGAILFVGVAAANILGRTGRIRDLRSVV